GPTTPITCYKLQGTQTLLAFGGDLALRPIRHPQVPFRQTHMLSGEVCRRRLSILILRGSPESPSKVLQVLASASSRKQLVVTDKLGPVQLGQSVQQAGMWFRRAAGVRIMQR